MSMTKAEVVEQLDELGIEYDSSSTKADLVALLTQRTPVPACSCGELMLDGQGTGCFNLNPDCAEHGTGVHTRPTWDAGESRSEYHARLREWKLEQRSR